MAQKHKLPPKEVSYALNDCARVLYSRSPSSRVFALNAGDRR